MSVGKPPHRPAGKADTSDEWRLESHAPRDQRLNVPSEKEIADENMEQMDRRGAPTQFAAEEQIGGSRPGVESRVRDAIEAREAREAEERSDEG